MRGWRDPKAGAEAHTENRTCRRSLLLAGIVLLALILRLAYLWSLRDTPFLQQLVLDLASYDAWAKEIAAGEWIGSKVFYQDPLYPYLLGAIYSLFGRHLTFVYVLQAVVGSFICLLVYAIGKRLLSERVALLAAATAAIYQPFIFFDIQLDKSFLAVLLTALSCLLLLRAIKGRKALQWTAAGAVLGMTALVRGNVLLLLPLLMVGLLWQEAGRAGRRAALIFTSGTAAVLLMVLLRNFAVGGDWVLTTSQAGQNFFIGNNPQNLTGMYRAPDFVRPDPRYEENDFAREAESIQERSLKPSEVSAFWLRRGLAFAAAQPAAFTLLQVKKAALFWNAYEIPDNLDIYFLQNYSFVLRLWLPSFGWVASLGLAGMLLCLKDWRRLWVLYAFVLGNFAGILPFFIFARYRLHVVPFLILFASEALWRIFDCLSERRIRSLLIAGMATAAAAAIVYMPLIDAYNPAALDNLGAVLLHMGEMGNAESLFRQVIARKPEYAGARSNLAVALLRKGEITAAIEQLREVIRLRSRDPNGYVNLGEAHARAGETAASEAAFLQALQLDPNSVQAHQGLGMLKHEMGEPDDAETLLRKSMELDPACNACANNLGIVLLARGRLREALGFFDDAVRMRPDFADAHYNRGVCLERAGDPTSAMDAYRRAITLRPDYAEAYNNLGNLLAATGDRPGARAAYQAFLRFWKGDPRVREAVAAEVDRLK